MASSKPLQPYLFGRLLSDLSSQGKATAGYEESIGQIMASRGYKSSLSTGKTLPTRAFARDLSTGVAVEGGNLVIDRLQEVAEAARPQLALDEAGVPRVELTSTGGASFVSWSDTAASTGWLVEGGSASTRSTLSVKEATANVRSSYAKLALTRRLRIQAGNIDVEAEILRELSAAVRQTLERGFINGKGSESEPHGLLNISSATSNSWAGSSPTRQELITQIKNFAANHGRLDRARFLLNSNLAASMLATEMVSQTGQFAMQIDPNGRPVCMGIPMILSEHMPDDRLLLIDPATIRTVYWGAPTLTVDSSTYATSGDSVAIVYNDADIVSIHPERICIGKAAAA